MQIKQHSCPASLEQTPTSTSTTIWPILRTHKNSTPCYLSTALSPQTKNTVLQQILSWFVLFPLPPFPSQLQAPSAIAVCLPAWLSGSDPLPINFVLDKRPWISRFPRPRFCGSCRNVEFTITIKNSKYQYKWKGIGISWKILLPIGSMITSFAKCHEEINRRIAMGKDAFYKRKKLIRGKLNKNL